MADDSKKRKLPVNNGPPPKRPRFPGKPQHKISATPASDAYPNGELNVSRFVHVHENEIKALESAMKVAKKGLMRRTFQDVPRDLRRRTAAHNPQRVPTRFRARTKKEAREDNVTITKSKSGSGIGKGPKKWLRQEVIDKKKKSREKRAKKSREDVDITVTMDVDTDKDNLPDKPAASDSGKPTTSKKQRQKQTALTVPNRPPAKFRKRQVHKTWLPTHLYHTKRAQITPPNEPLWRFAIPLSPATKSYRLTHRAATLRGAVAWDMSYISTIGLEGTEGSLVGLLKALRYAEEDAEEIWDERGKAKKWRAGLRTWEGWIHGREGEIPKKIAQVTVIWRARGSADEKTRQILIRVHPSAFLQLWNEVIRVSKVQKPAVVVEDLRFEIGSIEVTGPAATEALTSVLHPSPFGEAGANPALSVWPSLAPVTDLRTLPPNVLLHFPIVDPRLRCPPRPAKMSQDEVSHSHLLETLAYWPIDEHPSAAEVFDRDAILAASRSLPSQQSINRRKSAAAPGEYPDARPSDARIPILAYVSEHGKTWTILLPWKCVAPVWRSLMFYPVSTGGNPRFGGLLEKRQLHFERSVACFPFDCPGTDAGWAWEVAERAEREKEWRKRPRGKRIEWTTIDMGHGRKGEVGDPWACEWERLLPNSNDPAATEKKESSGKPATPLLQLSLQAASDLVAGRSSPKTFLSAPYIFAVKITMVQRGVPTTCARLYRLPTDNPDLREKWLSLMPCPKPSSTTKRDQNRPRNGNTKNVPQHIRNRRLAASLLERKDQTQDHMKAGDAEYPVVPNESSLIGFVTTGNYNLAEGKPSAIANLVLHRVFGVHDADAGIARKPLGKEDRVCIVREAGSTLGRLAVWDVAL
ncbi:ribonucleases P/MRP protein subunit POP1-domain-containing protein [Clohesyomyces aquaticus]|uniref:Ribonucleases P/MRP protein subunit POP1-domain-containing protein n=1 Tax=Clohesyomyces aquaticus TaxID=1231657 RepID=A0A1Y1YDP0_9PLEO|nr:ribonucleases P/MRP protein subunit POP1-domain-containing protein [Clohesyomyces aquaticus]